jgi:hypothetical protein
MVDIAVRGLSPYESSMYPLMDRSLGLLKVARHWRRDFPERPPLHEIVDTLLQAVWSGELLVRRNNETLMERKDLLMMIKEAASLGSGHPEIVIYEDTSIIPPEVRTLPDGSVEVDLAKRLHLPAEASLWTPNIIADACATLGSCGMSDFNPLMHPALVALRITRDAFETLCRGRGYELPHFWFGRDAAGTAKPESFGGRPSVMRQIEAEMRRRAESENLAPTLREQAKALHEWADKTIDPKSQVPQPLSIENALRNPYKALRAATRSKH